VMFLVSLPLNVRLKLPFLVLYGTGAIVVVVCDALAGYGPAGTAA
jgi:hypothetical protein